MEHKYFAGASLAAEAAAADMRGDWGTSQQLRAAANTALAANVQRRFPAMDAEDVRVYASLLCSAAERVATARIHRERAEQAEREGDRRAVEINRHGLRNSAEVVRMYREMAADAAPVANGQTAVATVAEDGEQDTSKGDTLKTYKDMSNAERDAFIAATPEHNYTRGDGRTTVYVFDHDVIRGRAEAFAYASSLRLAKLELTAEALRYVATEVTRAAERLEDPSATMPEVAELAGILATVASVTEDIAGRMAPWAEAGK